MTTESADKPKAGASLLWLVYRQIAAMLGAFSLLVFLTHFVHLEFEGIIREAVQVWTDYVRPPFGHALQWLANQLPESWRFTVPIFWQDYVSVGAINALSYIRASRTLKRDVLQEGDEGDDFFAQYVLLWPIALVIFPIRHFLHLIRREGNQTGDGFFLALWFAPLIYLGMLFAANAWLV